MKELDPRIRIRAPLRCDGIGRLDCAEDTVSLATLTIESSVEPIGIDTEPSTPTPRLAELLTFFSA